MPRATVYTDTLMRAVRVLGSREALAKSLEVTLPQLEQWMRGDELLPQHLFLRAVDIIVTRDESDPDGGISKGA